MEANNNNLSMDKKIESGNSDSVPQNDPDKNRLESFDQPRLHVAVMQNSIEDIELIIKGEDINCLNSEGDTVLHIGVISNSNISTIKYLLDLGAEINAKAANGITALHLAADLCRIDFIELLLRYGANVKNTDDFACSALHYASEPEAIQALIKAGGEVNAKSKMGFTPMHCLLLNDGSVESIESFLKAGADPNIKDNEGLTSLHYVAKFNFTQSNKDIFWMLLDFGADLNALTDGNKSVLELAIISKNSRIVEMIKGLLSNK